MVSFDRITNCRSQQYWQIIEKIYNEPNEVTEKMVEALIGAIKADTSGRLSSKMFGILNKELFSYIDN